MKMAIKANNGKTGLNHWHKIDNGNESGACNTILQNLFSSDGYENEFSEKERAHKKGFARSPSYMYYLHLLVLSFRYPLYW